MRKTGKYKSILKANLMLERRFIGNGESSILTEEITFDTTDIDDMVRAINDKDISVKLKNDVVITGKSQLTKISLFQLSLQIKTENGYRYFSFYDGKFSIGDNEIDDGMNDKSNDWLKAATKIYGLAEMKMYPERFAEYTKKGERPIVILNKNDWSEEIGKLTLSDDNDSQTDTSTDDLESDLKKAGYKWSSGNELNTDNDITGMPSYANFPYIIYVNDDNKTVDYRGEHTSFK